ncbi:YegP family protein [Pseudomonas citronellolis]|uniref:YegP family protein n=1 Tax=Pseudomonas citronellolis TaxID=53408 RepID=UPI00248E6163|nr:YegP family protein [Pseudomonas citronellolis]
MPGWYEIKKYSSGSHRFLLKTTASGTILESGAYESLDQAQQAIARLRECCAAPERFKRHMSPGGKNYFSLRDSAGSELLKSKLYDSESARDHAIEMVAKAGASKELRPHD